jgi:hypothetical protein
MNNPQSNNVTSIESKKPAAVATHTISYVLDGFPITTQVETTAPIADLIARLKQIGAQPPVQTPAQVEKAAGEDAPVCEFHGRMKKGNYGWFCPKKMGDGSYCKSKA